MAQIVWQVRRKGYQYNQTIQNPQGTNRYGPFEEFVGANLPADFEGEVVRRVVFDVPKYASEGWQPVGDVDAMAQQYAGGHD